MLHILFVIWTVILMLSRFQGLLNRQSNKVTVTKSYCAMNVAIPFWLTIMFLLARMWQSAGTVMRSKYVRDVLRFDHRSFAWVNLIYPSGSAYQYFCPVLCRNHFRPVGFNQYRCVFSFRCFALNSFWSAWSWYNWFFFPNPKFNVWGGFTQGSYTYYTCIISFSCFIIFGYVVSS